MATYFLFGQYSAEALKGISVERTEKATAVIKGLGSEVKSGYVLLGEHDLVLIVDLPGTEQAIKASVALSKLTGIGFTTSPAVSIAAFDKLMAEM